MSHSRSGRELQTTGIRAQIVGSEDRFKSMPLASQQLALASNVYDLQLVNVPIQSVTTATTLSVRVNH